MDLLIVDSNGYHMEVKNAPAIPRVGEKLWFRDSYIVTVENVLYNYYSNVVTITVSW